MTMPINDDDIKNAKQDADKRKAEKEQAKLKAEEKESNEAPRKAASDAFKYVKEKLGFKRGGSVKTKRYAVGGEADDTAKEKIVTKFGKTPGGEDTFERDREVTRTESESEAGPSSFKQAFAEARRRGDKTFMWNGERKTTELASAKKSSAPRPEPKETTKETTSEHLAEEFKKRPAGTGMKESARQSRVDRIRRNVGSNLENFGMKKGGSVKQKSASARADGIAVRGKTRA
jgi:hypothetical protein